MQHTTLVLRSVADQLLTIERESDVAAAAIPAALVCDKLKHVLGKLLGAGGFWALLSRAVTLAQAEARELAQVHVSVDGTLYGLEGIGPRGQTILIAHVIKLLVTFIGAPLTVRLLQDVWPGAPVERLDERSIAP